MQRMTMAAVHVGCSWYPRRVLFFTHHGLLLDPDQGGGGGGGGGGGTTDDPEEAARKAAAEAEAARKAATEKAFTQADIDRVVAKQRRELQEKHLEEIRRMQKAQGLTDEERNALKKRSEELEDALLSEKDRAKREIERTRKELQEQVEAVKATADRNWGLYTGSMIATEISHAAAAHKAFNPSQIEAIVRPMCVVEDEKDEKLNPTGRHVVLVKTRKKNDKGVVEEVAFSVEKFVEQMKTDDAFANLFLSERAGGMGYRPGAKGGKGGEGQNLSSREKIKAGLAQRR